MEKARHRHTGPTSSGRARPSRDAGTVTRGRVAWHAVFVLLVVPGCSDGAPRTAPTTPPTTTTPSPTPSAEPAMTFFSTPSKNIGCVVDGGLRCDIADHTWPLPSRPASCDADWGAGLTIDPAGKVGVGLCTSDSALGAEQVLAYGTHTDIGPFRCASAEEGVTCLHTETGRGFFLSRTSYRVID